jgi:hypothetical protein
MATDRENFEAWFVQPLMRLFPKKEFGFIVVMSTLPLLERYVRRKERIPSGVGLQNTSFYDGVLRIFPEIGSADLVRPFWKVFRHGLLHETTFHSKW